MGKLKEIDGEIYVPVSWGVGEPEQDFLATYINENALLRRLNRFKTNSDMTQYRSWKWISLIILGSINSIGFWIWW